MNFSIYPKHSLALFFLTVADISASTIERLKYSCKIIKSPYNLTAIREQEALAYRGAITARYWYVSIEPHSPPVPANILKVSRESWRIDEAQKKCDLLTHEYEELRRLIGPYVLPTVYRVEPIGWPLNTGVIVAQQPYISGCSLLEAVIARKLCNPNQFAINDFLQRLTQMYRSLGRLPDIFCDLFPTGEKLGFHQNIIVVNSVHDPYWPYIIDPCYSNKLKTPAGPLIFALMNRRIEKLIENL